MAIETPGQLFDKAHTCQCQLTSLEGLEGRLP